MFEIIEKLGGWDKVKPVLDDGGVKTNSGAVSKWKTRGMPWQAKYCLALMARRQDVDFKDEDFSLKGAA